MTMVTPHSGPRISTETLHASTVALDGRAVLITGPSGSGKSDLSLRLMDRGFLLVSDDRTVVRRSDAGLVASAPPNIAGKLEVRGIGIVDVEAASEAAVCLVAELNSDIERIPDDGQGRLILGITVPVVGIDARSASAPAKVALALDRLGLKVA